MAPLRDYNVYLRNITKFEKELDIKDSVARKAYNQEFKEVKWNALKKSDGGDPNRVAFAFNNKLGVWDESCAKPGKVQHIKTFGGRANSH